ncbi:MAG: hypothetical protein SFU98_05970, partial [Leptospiraceae bacterium]|nr:hypothetical protein [Leptospiraceae bacterium]
MKFWIYLLLALGCATVEKKEGLKVATIAPILDESIFSEGKENIPSYDYKYRKVKNEYPIYSFYPITYPESFPKELKELFKEEMVQLWNRTGARFEDVSKEIFSDRNKLLSVSEKLQLDAFIRCLWKEKEGVYSIEEEIVDPITERVSAVVSFQIKVLRPKKNAKKNEWLIYRGKETFTVLEEKTSPELKFVSLPTSDTLKKAIDSSFFANLN